MPANRSNCVVEPAHVAEALFRETMYPRPWTYWAQGVADTIGLVPVLNVPAEIVSGGLSLREGDLIGVALSVAGLLPIAGEFAIAVKIARRARRLSQGARFGAKVAGRARRLARMSGQLPVTEHRRGEAA